MAERLHDATAELRVRFKNGDRTQEFIATMTAAKFTPMVVDFKRDPITQSGGPGGTITIETSAEIDVVRRVIETLPHEIDQSIEAWLDAKRLELREIAAKKVKAGAERVRINERGEMRKG